MKLSDRLVDDWRDSWRWWSVRLAAVWAILVGVLAAVPDALPGLINQLPEDVRHWLPAPIVILCFALPTLLRLWKQVPKGGGNGAN